MADRFLHLLEVRVADRPAPAPVREVVLPSVDDDETETEFLGDAEGQSFMIEYVDSAGRPSTRRITVYGLSKGKGGIPTLYAKCFERQAMRSFRVDRIRCCIDYSGEIHENVPLFLSDAFGMPIAIAGRTVRRDVDARWDDIIGLVRSDAVLLSAISRADSQLHELEIAAAARYLAQEIERTKDILTDAEINSLSGYFRRLRPTENSLRRAFNEIARQEEGKITRLLRAAVDVLDADGLRHPAEIDLIDQFCREMTGVSILT